MRQLLSTWYEQKSFHHEFTVLRLACLSFQPFSQPANGHSHTEPADVTNHTTLFKCQDSLETKDTSAENIIFPDRNKTEKTNAAKSAKPISPSSAKTSAGTLWG